MVRQSARDIFGERRTVKNEYKYRFYLRFVMLKMLAFSFPIKLVNIYQF